MPTEAETELIARCRRQTRIALHAQNALR